MIKPDDVILLLADLQDEIIPLSSTNEPAKVRKAAAAVARLAASLAIPAIASDIPFGSDDPKPVSEILEAYPGLPVLKRTGPQIFAHAGTAEAIRAHGRPILAIAGVTSEIAVLNAALAGLAAGYKVHVLVDACGGLTARTEDAAWHQIRAAGGETSSVLSLATAMVDDFGTPAGGKVMATLLEMLG